MESFHKSTAREYFESIVIAVILALFIRTWVVQAFKIPTGSMEKNLLVGDHLLVNKFVFGPIENDVEYRVLPVDEVKRGDVVVFKFPEEPERDFIKRVIGLPGEQLEIRRKEIYIDGMLIDEPYLANQVPLLSPTETPIERRDNFGPIKIPEAHYFVLGDNRDNSQDSRFWGPLPHTHLKGRALVLYWAIQTNHKQILHEPGVVPAVKRFVVRARDVFSGTRWNRIFRQIE